MFDFAWSEIAVIGVVALIAIGPKDMPVAIRALAQMMKKARRMAGEFQTHVDEMVREANLQDVRQQINELKNFDIKGTVERAVDPDGKLRETVKETMRDPFVAETPATHVESPATPTIARPSDADPAPAFIPPAEEPQQEEAPKETVQAAPESPAFIPPGTSRG